MSKNKSQSSDPISRAKLYSIYLICIVVIALVAYAVGVILPQTEKKMAAEMAQKYGAEQCFIPQNMCIFKTSATVGGKIYCKFVTVNETTYFGNCLERGVEVNTTR